MVLRMQAVHDDGKYNIYKPDADGIIPICDDEYFEDDMMGRFVEFVRVVCGDNSLEDNLRFVANALGGKGQAEGGHPQLLPERFLCRPLQDLSEAAHLLAV